VSIVLPTSISDAVLFQTKWFIGGVKSVSYYNARMWLSKIIFQKLRKMFTSNNMLANDFDENADITLITAWMWHPAILIAYYNGFLTIVINIITKTIFVIPV